jgi:hypothetical protein
MKDPENPAFVALLKRFDEFVARRLKRWLKEQGELRPVKRRRGVKG